MKIQMRHSETGIWPGTSVTYHCRAGAVLEVPLDVPRSMADAWVAQDIADIVEPGSALPDGYTIRKHTGGYYTLLDPTGKVVEGPSNRKWQGEDGAVQGARAHFHQQEKE